MQRISLLSYPFYAWSNFFSKTDSQDQLFVNTGAQGSVGFIFNLVWPIWPFIPDFQQPADLTFICGTFPSHSAPPRANTAPRLHQSSFLDLSMMQAVCHTWGSELRMPLSIHSFNEYLLTVHSVPGTLLESKPNRQKSLPWKVYFLAGKRDKQKQHKLMLQTIQIH